MPTFVTRLLYHLIRFTILTVFLLSMTHCAFFSTPYPGLFSGQSFKGTPAPLTQAEASTRDIMHRHLEHLSVKIGARRMVDGSLDKAANYIIQAFTDMGYIPTIQEYKVDDMSAQNIIVEIKGSTKPDEIIIVGGHYDTGGTAGANDNGTGTVATLVLAKSLKNSKPQRTIRFIAFANEEPSYFQSETMGSLVYARSVKAKKENIIAMYSLETMGYYSDAPNSQKYPPPLNSFYPDQGNFIGFVSNRNSSALIKDTIRIFRDNAEIPSEAGIFPEYINGVGWSDHWSFWKVGYPAIMVTDTAIFRYPYYHHPEDTIDKINFDALTRVVSGLEKVLITLANE